MNRDITERLESMFTGSGIIRGFANGLKKLLDKLFARGPLRPLKILLNGTLFEHPLHPLLTDVVVGAWTVALLLDVLALLLGVPNLGIASAIAVALGVLAAAGAIAAGLMDWMDIGPDELVVGITHGLINTTATILFAISFVLRWMDGWNIGGGAFALALAGYLVVTLGAFIGGSLVYRMGVMVNRNAYRRTDPAYFVRVIALKDLPENQPVRVDAEGEPVLLVRRSESVFAIGAICSHYGVSLEGGEIKDGTIECPLHGSRFALANGCVKGGPTTAPVPHYQTRISNGQVEVKLDKGSQKSA